MIYKKALIYFMSGTGNSYRVGFWMHDLCQQLGIQSKIVPIDAAEPRFFTWTTFTHIFRRFHDPETKISDLSQKGS